MFKNDILKKKEKRLFYLGSKTYWSGKREKKGSTLICYD